MMSTHAASRTVSPVQLLKFSWSSIAPKETTQSPQLLCFTMVGRSPKYAKVFKLSNELAG